MSNKIEDSNLLAFCGLYCGDCHGYNGKIPDLACDLRKELRDIHYDKFAQFISTYSFGKDFKNYEECYKVLGAMVKFRCKRGCRDSDGLPFCKISKCVQKKGLGCYWECLEFVNCKELKFLETIHDNAHIKNLREFKKNGKKDFFKGKTLWYI